MLLALMAVCQAHPHWCHSVGRCRVAIFKESVSTIVFGVPAVTPSQSPTASRGAPKNLSRALTKVADPTAPPIRGRSARTFAVMNPYTSAGSRNSANACSTLGSMLFAPPPPRAVHAALNHVTMLLHETLEYTVLASQSDQRISCFLISMDDHRSQ